MKQRLSLAMSATALLVALLATTPLGHAAGEAVLAKVPYAARAGFALNAGKLNGRTSSLKPRAGQIPVLDPSGKLPASIGAVGPQGAAGAAGPPGATGYEQVVKENVRIDAGNRNAGDDVSCPAGKSLISGGYVITSTALLSGGGDFIVREAEPVSNQIWRFRAYHPTGNSGTVTLRIICAAVAG
jgi:hypothetical protein